jgi:aspartate/methionine/tyrosine aminotransferase
MTFSRRTAWDRAPNEMARLLETARLREDLVDLTESNPTRVGLAADSRELAAALADPGNVRYEPDALGLPDARAAVAAWYRERSVDVDVERILLTASTSEAYAFLFKLACDPGDAVIVPTPSYPLFEDLARLESVEVVTHRLRLSDRWRLDVDALAASLPERTRAILIVSPNNPTGSMLLPDELRALAHVAASHGLLLVADEVFAEFPWSGAPRHAELLSLGEREGALVAVLSGLSKACGLPQLKLGWMLLGGPEALVAEARARLELVADAALSVATPVQRGLRSLLRMGDAFRDAMRERLAANLATLRASGLHVLPAEGGWNAIVPLPEAETEERVVRELLERDGVLVHPGWLFDLPSGHLVVSLIIEPARFARGCEALVRRLR